MDGRTDASHHFIMHPLYGGREHNKYVNHKLVQHVNRNISNALVCKSVRKNVNKIKVKRISVQA